MPRHPLTPICFGKLPTRGDFVRHDAGRPAVRAFDDWVRRGLRTAGTQPGFGSAFDEASAHCFFFSPPAGGGPLIGVMQPSRDRSGRRYPFFVALDAGGRDLPAHLAARVPIQLCTFFEEALALTGGAVEGRLAPRDVAARLDPVTLPARSDTPALRGYKRYLRQTRLEAFWAQLWNGRTDECKHRLVGNLVEVLHPLQGRVPVRFTLGLQFPLPSDADGAAPSAYAAGFWWEVCLRLLRFPDVAPTCFWAPAAAADPSLLLFLRPPPAAVFAYLFGAASESDHVYVLDRHGTAGTAQAAREAPPRYGRLLNGEAGALWDVLQHLDA